KSDMRIVMSIQVKPIHRRELLAYQADVKGSIFRQIRERFARLRESGFSQKDLAARINMDEGQLSRRLRGDYDLKLETLSDLARGLECRIDVRLTPLAEVRVDQPRYIASPKSSKPPIETQIDKATPSRTEPIGDRSGNE